MQLKMRAQEMLSSGNLQSTSPAAPIFAPFRSLQRVLPHYAVMICLSPHTHGTTFRASAYEPNSPFLITKASRLET